MKVRTSQMDNFNEQSLNDFKERLKNHISAMVPAANLPPANELATRIETGLTICRSCDISKEQDAAHLFEIIFMNCSGFAERLPKNVLHILHLHGIAVDEKLRRLRETVQPPPSRRRIYETGIDFGSQAFGGSVQPCPLARPPAAGVEWVEIVLIGEDNKPIPHEQYEVTTPDGQTLKGYLGGDGRIRVSIAQAGKCRISFPDLDQDAWERVQS